MLEKYRKLAHDASLNDDRVQTEYYLQFADHYFRVLADSKAPKDENRLRRDNERDESYDDDQDEDSGFDERSYDNRTSDNRMPDNRTADSRGADNNRGTDSRERDSRGTDSRNTDSDTDSRGTNNRERDGGGQSRRAGHVQRDTVHEDELAEQGAAQNEGEGQEADAADNPFIRDTRPRKPRGRPSRNAASEGVRDEAIDPATLPPPITRGLDDQVDAVAADVDAETEDAPAKPPRAARAAKPRTTRARTRQPRPAEDGDAEALEAVS